MRPCHHVFIIFLFYLELPVLSEKEEREADLIISVFGMNMVNSLIY